MPRNSKSSEGKSKRTATTPEGRENQLVSLAFDLVEKRLTDGTASATETVHLLKLGSTRERLEQKRIEHENLLLSAKVDQLSAAKRIEELYEEAIVAMRRYSGQTDTSGEFEGFDDFEQL